MLRLDCQNMKCPLPLLKLKVALAPMQVGERILLQATDPIACRDIPTFCAQQGHQILSQRVDPIFEFEIEKGAPPRPL